ncbi:MAG TPA: CoA transferase [Gemmatimonadaceae bacterium]|nr:MAG: CoA-transferase [Gemmatimonadetes bacterium SCN 70-22]HMN10200.1 CoA transferase [Gemmatimonadaceae bacterium]
MTVPLSLDGVRVLDLTQVMAGPFCTMQLGDMGADVIKVEPPGTGDLSRSMGGAPLRMTGDDNAPFFALNRNKRSVTLDLKDPADRERFRALARTADVVVENFRPGVTQRLGVDYATLSALNPRLVYASISGFGQDGPYADRPGFDLIAQGMAGVMSVTGEPGRAPVKCGIPIADLAAGLYATTGILAALLARERTGRGQHIETSLYDAALALSVWESTEYWCTGVAPQAMGSAHRLNAPYQVFATRDGHVALAALTPQQWEQLCRVLGRPALASDQRFGTNAQRMAHREALVRVIEEVLAARTSDEWVEALLAAGVPAGPIHDYAQALDDPHTRARHMVMEIEHPVEGVIKSLGFPVRMGGTPLAVRRAPPLLGQHTAEVMGELAHPTPGPSAEGSGAR